MPRDDCRVVTGYVRLDNGNRGHVDYAALGSRLLSLGVPTTAYLDPIGTADIRVGAGVEVWPVSLDDCWLRRMATKPLLPSGNPTKDTLDYHAVQHQKSSLIDAASVTASESVLVWIDFGLLHVRGVTEAGIVGLVSRLSERAALDRITVASIWGPPPIGSVDPLRVNWWCAGGVLVVPRTLAAWFDRRVRDTAESLYRLTGRVTWEVNTWAQVWAHHPERFAHWRCDHDGSLVEAGP